MNKQKQKISRLMTAGIIALSAIGINELRAQTLPPYQSDTMANLVAKAVTAKYSVPSYTELQHRLIAAKANPNDSTQDALKMALENLQTFQNPFNIVVTIYKDPTSKMAFNWFTNANVTGGRLEVVQGVVTSSTAFANPLFSVPAICLQTGNLPYAHSRNGLDTTAGIATGSTRSYTENKALLQGLTPNTTYSFRVGKDGYWSEIGKFTTAKTSTEPFSFIYTTDPQANTYEMFDISKSTAHAAFNTNPNANFWLHCGDLIESAGGSNSEWEWEQFFETQQDLFLNIPFAPIIGNHDNSTNKNFTKHFLTDSLVFDRNMATTPGSTYSYVYGNALFFAINSEEWNNAAYGDSLARWMYNIAASHPNIKWRIAYTHKTIYTGSQSHQSDADGRTWREKMTPIYDSLKIDIAFQGHDHIYEVIGPLNNGQLVANAVSNQQSVTIDPRTNVTGKLGGVFNTQNGTLYFLNNSSGKKKYEPRSQSQMNAANTQTGITDYFSFFTGRFGQTGNPTFSNVHVTTDTITLSTYEVFDDGSVSLFDEFKVVKPNDAGFSGILQESNQLQLIPNPAKEQVTVKTDGIKAQCNISVISLSGAVLLEQHFDSRAANSLTLDLSNLAKGSYIVQLKTENGKIYTQKLIIN